MGLADGRSLDYQLMRDTPVRVFDDLDLLAEVRDWLADHEFRIIEVDVAATAPGKLYVQMAWQAPEWPKGYVNDVDGFNDALRDLEGDCIAFIFHGYREFAQRYPREAVAVLDCLAAQAWWYLLSGRRLVALADRPDFDLPALGGKAPLLYYAHPTFED